MSAGRGWRQVPSRADGMRDLSARCWAGPRRPRSMRGVLDSIVPSVALCGLVFATGCGASTVEAPDGSAADGAAADATADGPDDSYAEAAADGGADVASDVLEAGDCGPAPDAGYFACCSGMPCRGQCHPDGTCWCFGIEGGCWTNAVCCMPDICSAPNRC